MEDIKAYIESGILELYVLGDVTREEKLGVEAMLAKHPAVKAELTEIERSLESYAAVNAVEPAAEQRDRILNSLLTNFGDDRNFHSKNNVEEEDNVVPFKAPATTNFYKYAFAACLALLLASVVALVSVYSKLQDSNDQLVALNTRNTQYSKTVNLMDQQLGVFRDTTYKLLKMKGTPIAPQAVLTVAWSLAKKKVMLDMGSAKMPVNDKTHQYQLWALVGGKPVDLGVFDEDPDSTNMKEMKSIASADAFAVTLEPRGGSVSPTMSEMMVLGKF